MLRSAVAQQLKQAVKQFLLNAAKHATLCSVTQSLLCDYIMFSALHHSTHFRKYLCLLVSYINDSYITPPSEQLLR
jgi:uncharacterized membrane protein YoaT (DUF817 family)